MQHGRDRILTTHTGSLPRPRGAGRGSMSAKARGEAVDARTRRSGPRRAAKTIVASSTTPASTSATTASSSARRSSSTSAPHERLRRRAGQRPPRGDVERYPAFKAAMARDAGRRASRSATASRARRRSARCAISTARRSKPNARDFRAALDAHRQSVRRAVHDRAVARHRRRRAAQRVLPRARTPISPRSARRCSVEYEAIVDHGFLLQLDCPDLAMERHISYQDRPLGDFLGFVERVVDDDQPRAGQHPARPGAAARLLGQLRRPARLRRGTARDHADPAQAEGRRLRAAVRQSAPRARIQRAARLPARRRPDHRRRRDRQRDQLRRAPEDRRRTASSASREVVGDPKRVHGRHRLRLRHLGRHAPRRRGRGLGEARGTQRGRADRVASGCSKGGPRRCTPRTW